ncbi:MAG TPA: hypothetical protein VGR31_02775 [Planctomycetota bacterium]|jgi:hypothetical protein|nr:hypothetical protein [Planctomycetota bacterium]
MEFNKAFDPIRALQASWKALAQAPLPLLVGGVLLCLTDGGGGGGGGRFSSFEHHNGGMRWEDVRPFVLPVIVFCGCVGIALFLFSSWIRVGFANAVESALRTGHATVGQVFDAKGRFGNQVLSRLLTFVINIVCALPFFALVVVIGIVTKGFERHEELMLVLIPGGLIWLPFFLYVVLGISLADQAVSLEGAQPVDSLKRSWSLVSGHRWMLLLYYIVGVVFTLVGFCACCIGVFFTGSLVQIAKSESYLALVKGTERPGWWIEKGFAAAPAPEGWGTPPPVPPIPSA